MFPSHDIGGVKKGDIGGYIKKKRIFLMKVIVGYLAMHVYMIMLMYMVML